MLTSNDISVQQWIRVKWKRKSVLYLIFRVPSAQNPDWWFYLPACCGVDAVSNAIISETFSARFHQGNFVSIPGLLQTRQGDVQVSPFPPKRRLSRKVQRLLDNWNTTIFIIKWHTSLMKKDHLALKLHKLKYIKNSSENTSFIIFSVRCLVVSHQRDPRIAAGKIKTK